MKCLVVTADDFGAAREVNDAVLDAHANGILTAASLMVAAPFAADAVARARAMPSLRVGLHLVLVEGAPVLPVSQVPDLVDPQGNFRTDMALAGAAMFFLPHVKRQLAEEIAAQFAAFRATGLALDHVNAHKHFHLHPTIAALMLSIGRDFGLKAARVPLEPAATLARIESYKGSSVAALTRPFAQGLRRRFSRAGIVSPDAVFGLAWSGAMTGPRLKGIIDNLPTGLSEIYLHPATGVYPGRGPRLPLCGGARRPAGPGCHCGNARRGYPSWRLLRLSDTLRPKMSTHVFATPPDLSRDTGTWPGGGPIKLGSDEHKRLFCKTLLDTFDPYRPAVLDWPRLEPEAEKRITSLPIWDIAVQTENKAGMNVCTYAEGVPDPLLRKAIELNGFEERRHRHVLANLVEAYGVKLAPEPVPARPKDPEWAFMVTGYSECIDSFFAFGLFKAAKDTGYFPPELVQTFDPVVNEEARHILFFVNWIAWHRRNMPFWRRPYFELKVLAVWIFLIYERIGIAKDVGHGEQDANFTVNGAEALGSDLDVGGLVAVCLEENDRRLAPYDVRLKRPRFVPFMARIALKFIGPKKPAIEKKVA